MLDFLLDRFPQIDAGEWRSRLARGDVFDEEGAPILPGQRYLAHRRLYYFRSVPSEPDVPLTETLLYLDEHIAVVDKPHGLAVAPAGRHLRETVLVRLRQRLGIDSITPIHRIDRDTAGLVLFSLQPATRDAYHRLFRERQVEKRYEAIAPFRADQAFPVTRRSRLVEAQASFMQMREGQGEPNAETCIDVIEVRGDFARYDLRPRTGLRHQLRVHLTALGVPIVNDRIYPVLQPDTVDDPLATEHERRRPLQLLAKRLTFIDPLTQEARSFESAKALRFPTETDHD